MVVSRAPLSKGCGLSLAQHSCRAIIKPSLLQLLLKRPPPPSVLLTRRQMPAAGAPSRRCPWQSVWVSALCEYMDAIRRVPVRLEPCVGIYLCVGAVVLGFRPTETSNFNFVPHVRRTAPQLQLSNLIFSNFCPHPAHTSLTCMPVVV